MLGAVICSGSIGSQCLGTPVSVKKREPLRGRVTSPGPSPFSLETSVPGPKLLSCSESTALGPFRSTLGASRRLCLRLDLAPRFQDSVPSLNGHAGLRERLADAGTGSIKTGSRIGQGKAGRIPTGGPDGWPFMRRGDQRSDGWPNGTRPPRNHFKLMGGRSRLDTCRSKSSLDNSSAHPLRSLT